MQRDNYEQKYRHIHFYQKIVKDNEVDRILSKHGYQSVFDFF